MAGPATGPTGPNFAAKAMLVTGRTAKQPFEIPQELTRASQNQGVMTHNAVGALNDTAKAAVEVLQPRGPAKWLFNTVFGKVDTALAKNEAQATMATNLFWNPFSKASNDVGQAIANPFALGYAKRAGFEIPTVAEDLLAMLTKITSGEDGRFPVPAAPEEPPAGDPPAGDPPADTPPADTPPADTPPADTPPADTPPADTPPADTPPADTPPADTPPADTPPADTPPADTPPADTPPADTPPADTPPADTPPADTPPADTPPADTPPADTPPADTPPADTPPADTPPADTPPADTPPADTPPADTPGGAPPAAAAPTA